MGTGGGWFAMAACHVPGLRLGVSGGRAVGLWGKGELSDRAAFHPAWQG